MPTGLTSLVSLLRLSWKRGRWMGVCFISAWVGWSADASVPVRLSCTIQWREPARSHGTRAALGTGQQHVRGHHHSARVHWPFQADRRPQIRGQSDLRLLPFLLVISSKLPATISTNCIYPVQKGVPDSAAILNEFYLYGTNYCQTKLITACSELCKVLFLSLSVTFCVWNISGTAEWICTKVTGKTCLVRRSDDFECHGRRSRSPWTKNSIFWFFRRPAYGLCLVKHNIFSSS